MCEGSVGGGFVAYDHAQCDIAVCTGKPPSSSALPYGCCFKVLTLTYHRSSSCLLRRLTVL